MCLFVRSPLAFCKRPLDARDRWMWLQVPCRLQVSVLRAIALDSLQHPAPRYCKQARLKGVLPLGIASYTASDMYAGQWQPGTDSSFPSKELSK